MQVLGGYGYTNEYKIERFLRDAKLNEIGGGTLESHQKNLTRDLTRERLEAVEGLGRGECAELRTNVRSHARPSRTSGPRRTA